MPPKEESNIHEAFRIFLDEKEVTNSNPLGFSLEESGIDDKYILVDRKAVEEQLNKIQVIINELKHELFQQLQSILP